MRTLLADGNFKQDHLDNTNDADDVSLSDGHGFMVTKAPFEAYMASAPKNTILVSQERSVCILLADCVQHSTCHEHRAVTQQGRAQNHLDATGIGAIACGRHGCFYPHSVVNFRKGEGYVGHCPDGGL